MTDLKKCGCCGAPADMRIGWPRCDGEGRVCGPAEMNAVCGACASSIWNDLSKTAAGTEAYMSFCIEPIV